MSSATSSAPFYAITGVTGKVGKVAALELIAKGQRVRGIVRDAKSKESQELAAQGVEIFEVAGGFFDAVGLTAAFTGAAGVFIMSPPVTSGWGSREAHDGMVKGLVAATKASGVPKVAVLSSWGAEQDHGTGIVLRLHDLEVEFGKLAADVVFLRAGYFMENMSKLLPIARDHGTLIAMPTADLALPFVATQDIGTITAQVLRENFKGKRYIEVQGPHHVTYNEAAQIVSKILKQPVTVVQVPSDQFVDKFLQIGYPQDGAEAAAELIVGTISGHAKFHGDIEIFRGTTSFEVVAREILGL